MIAKAYSYTRFSSPEQAKGRSAARQIEACERYCREHGLELDLSEEFTFKDEGLSGFKGEHLGEKGQLARFLKLITSGKIEPGSTLVVESLDRLSRQHVKKALLQLLQLTEAGIRVVTLSDGQVYDDNLDTQDLLLSIFVMSRAHEESAIKSRRVRDAMRKKHELARSERKPMGRVAPMWLEVKEGRFEPIPERVEVVRKIFQLTIDGRGKGVVAKMLNEEGHPSFKGGTWGTSSVDKVLKNRAVFGEYVPHSIQGSPTGRREPTGDPIPGYFPTVIDVATYWLAQAATDGRRSTAATKQSERFNLFQGVAKCEHCAGAMHIVRKGLPPKGGTYLHCANARKGQCKGRAVRLERAEAVFKGMLGRLNTIELVNDSSETLSKQLAAAGAQLEAMKAKLVEYQRIFEETPAKTIGQIIGRAEEDIAILARDCERLQTELAAEKGVGWDEFFERLDLVSYEGRARANSLVKRLKVTVRIGPSGYEVWKDGDPYLGMDYRDGQAGYLTQTAIGRSVRQTFVPVSEVVSRAEANDAYEAWLATLEDEGHPAGEY